VRTLPRRLLRCVCPRLVDLHHSCSFRYPLSRSSAFTQTVTGVAARGAADRGPQALTGALEQRDETCGSEPPLKGRHRPTSGQTEQAEERGEQSWDGAGM
jgi:hypothetical protein